MTTAEQLITPKICNWCPGCGNFAIWTAFRRAAEKEGWDCGNTAFVAGIGCHGHIVNFVKLTSFEGLHGRSLPVAGGLKLANHKLNVFVFTGDGDSLAEGGNHFIHAARRNQDLTVFLHDNAVYGLTTGQTSPRSPVGYKSKSTPFGNIEEPLSPVRMAIAAGATFVARVYSGDIEATAQMMIKANTHRGFSVIDILQPCATFNHLYTHAYYHDNIYQLDASYDPTDKMAAFEKSLEWGEKKIPVGVIYQEDRPSYEDQLPQLKQKALVAGEVKVRDVSKLFQKYL